VKKFIMYKSYSRKIKTILIDNSSYKRFINFKFHLIETSAVSCIIMCIVLLP
jgi:hypothetical protein